MPICHQKTFIFHLPYVYLAMYAPNLCLSGRRISPVTLPSYIDIPSWKLVLRGHLDNYGMDLAGLMILGCNQSHSPTCTTYGMQFLTVGLFFFSSHL